MKITYYAIALAATIFGGVVVAQTETPTPDPSIETDSSAVRQPNAPALPKKPTPPPFHPRPDTTLRQPYTPALPKKPTHRYQPDTTLRVTPTVTPIPLRKKPTPTPTPFKRKLPTPTPTTKTQPSLNAPSTVSATVAPRYQPRPDTTSRVTPTPVPPFNPFNTQLGPPPFSWHNGSQTFENGVKVEISGDDMIVTDARGHRSVTHKHELNHEPPGPALPRGCGQLLHWLLTHGPNTYKWRYGSALYFSHC
jgi:hypothetical protein